MMKYRLGVAVMPCRYMNWPFFILYKNELSMRNLKVFTETLLNKGCFKRRFLRESCALMSPELLCSSYYKMRERTCASTLSKS